jgi:uncharacterized damage-inducible protein DinB
VGQANARAYAPRMSWLEQYRSLALYNQLMNRKLYALAATLSDDERRRDRGAFFKSIHGTFNHLLLGDRIWMLRLTGDEARYVSKDDGGAPIVLKTMAQELYPDFSTLTRERERTDADIIDAIQGLTEADLMSELSYERAGVQVRHVRWWALTHFFNHQTHHRGQATTLFSQAGVDPGVTDLIALLRDPAGFATKLRPVMHGDT